MIFWNCEIVILRNCDFAKLRKLWFCEIAKIVKIHNFEKFSKLVIRKNSNWLIPELNSQKDLLTSLNLLLMVFSNHWWTKKWISEIFLKNWTRPWTIWCQWPNFTISCAFHRFRYILELNQPLEHFFTSQNHLIWVSTLFVSNFYALSCIKFSVHHRTNDQKFEKNENFWLRCSLNESDFLFHRHCASLALQK